MLVGKCKFPPSAIANFPENPGKRDKHPKWLKSTTGLANSISDLITIQYFPELRARAIFPAPDSKAFLKHALGSNRMIARNESQPLRPKAIENGSKPIVNGTMWRQKKVVKPPRRKVQKGKKPQRHHGFLSHIFNSRDFVSPNSAACIIHELLLLAPGRLTFVCWITSKIPNGLVHQGGDFISAWENKVGEIDWNGGVLK